MEDLIFIVLCFGIAFLMFYGTFKWAEAWGRRGWLWCVHLFLFGGFAWIVLLIMGRSDELKAQRIAQKVKDTL